LRSGSYVPISCCGVDGENNNLCWVGGQVVGSIVLVAALAATFPAVEVQRHCLHAEAAALPDRRASIYENCVHEEEKARAILSHRWTTFPGDARQLCTGGGQASYVEILTCLQIQSNGDLDADLINKPAVAHRDAPPRPKATVPARLASPVTEGPTPQLPARLGAPEK
jgi:hypothetical protein